MTRRESGSNRYLQRKCGYWRRPDVPLVDGDATEARDDGNELHALAADEINGTDDALGGEAAIAMFVGLRPLLDKLRARPGVVALAEVSYAYSPETNRARRLGAGLSREARDALLEGDEYAGTIDLVLLDDYDARGTMWRTPKSIDIFDHKTSWVGGTPQDATDQLATYLAIAAMAEGASEGTATPIVVSTERSDLGVGIVMDSFSIEIEIEDLRAELREDVSAAQPNPGTWCHARYCKARAACPATTQAIARVLPAEALVRPYTPGQGYADAAQLEKGRVARKLIEEAAKAMKADERAFLEKHGDVEFSDGSVFYLQRSAPEKADLAVPGAVALLTKEGASGAIKQSVAWSDIKKLVGKDGEAAVREGLRAIGAIKKNSFDKPATKPAKGRAKRSPMEAFDAEVRKVMAALDTPGSDATGDEE